MHRLQEVESSNKEGSLSFTLYGSNVREAGWSSLLLLLRRLLFLQSNSCRPDRSRENNFHMSIRSICIIVSNYLCDIVNKRNGKKDSKEYYKITHLFIFSIKAGRKQTQTIILPIFTHIEQN
ncbi:unnamed protein product [Trifolium pratense]|uniref:Uncharacterized protein n=1 Tax=Trifolium pratense TaxID=57577 RepID=A0ACB0JAN6_TRIPR|nr:unnamed protein product [Trifolium pratense]